MMNSCINALSVLCTKGRWKHLEDEAGEREAAKDGELGGHCAAGVGVQFRHVIPCVMLHVRQAIISAGPHGHDCFH